MKKDKAYKVVAEIDGKLMSLYTKSLGNYAIEYSDKQETKDDKICFVFGCFAFAEDIWEWFRCSRNTQLWECEGYFVDMPVYFKTISICTGLAIDERSKLMKNVRLVRRIK